MTNRFICVNDNNDFKKLSLEDNVYFTLRDIFFNNECIEDVIKVNEFNSMLTGNIYFEDRTSDFKYTDLLNDKKFLYNLKTFLKTINPIYFRLIEEEVVKLDEDEDEENYDIPFSDWVIQFEDLKQKLENKYNELS
jgi:hypothetical protein